jgi:predicted GTPase
VLVLDATQGFTAEDKRIAARVMEVGRGLLVVANKWDLVQERDRRYRELGEEMAPSPGRRCFGPRRRPERGSTGCRPS